MPTGSLMISPTTPATRDSTFFSIATSSRMVLMIALIAPIALSTRPLFSACSASIRSSSPLRASTYLVASVSTTDSCLASTSLSSCSNRLADLLDGLRTDLLQIRRQTLDVGGDLALPLAIRCLAAVRSSATMSATREITPSICLRYSSRPAS